MGEERATVDNITSTHQDCITFCLDDNLNVATDIVHLHSFVADKLICVHNEASGYIALRFDHNLEETWMIRYRGNNGEMSNAA